MNIKNMFKIAANLLYYLNFRNILYAQYLFLYFI